MPYGEIATPPPNCRRTEAHPYMSVVCEQSAIFRAHGNEATLVLPRMASEELYMAETLAEGGEA